MLPRSRRVAGPWVRAIVGPQRGRVSRYGQLGEVVATARSDAEKLVLDHQLRGRGYLLVDAPRGYEAEADPAPPRS